MGLVADRLAFSAPSLAFSRCRPGLRGFPGPVVAQQPKLPSTSPRDLDFPSRALEGAPGRLAPTPTLLGFVRVRPSADVPLSRPLPGAEAPFGPTAPPAGLVPPSWFLTTMTAYSAREGAGLLHPATDRGFAAFRDSRWPVPSAPRGSGHRSPGSFPATRFTPSEDFPRRQPYRITAAVALLPFPSLPVRGTWPKPRPGSGNRSAEAGRV